MSTIAAISTPNAIGGISVIRISGEDAIGVAEKIFSPCGGKKVSDMAGYTCAYGIAHDGDERLDDCILTVFRAPHSYTGEDVVEISCHGGLYVTRKVLRAALSNGAMNAEAGEFTKRAYLNGKLDLTQAEAVMDIISAKGERELKMAENLREGAAFKKAEKCSGKLMKILGDLAAWADYPEEDIPEVRPETLIEELSEVRNDLKSLVQNYDSGTTAANIGKFILRGSHKHCPFKQVRHLADVHDMPFVRESSPLLHMSVALDPFIHAHHVRILLAKFHDVTNR